MHHLIVERMGPMQMLEMPYCNSQSFVDACSYPVSIELKGALVSQYGAYSGTLPAFGAHAQYAEAKRHVDKAFVKLYDRILQGNRGVLFGWI